MLFIRVLSQSAHNKYTVSYNGGRFSLSSNVPLKIGDAFLVKINLNDDKIELVPVKQETASITSGQNVSEKIPLSLAGMTNQNISPEIAMFLNSLGVAADTIFLQIFLQMRSLGMKIDSALMQKIWRVSKNFVGHENEAIDVAVALEQKGISADVKTIAAFMGAFAFGTGSGDENSRGRNYFSGDDFSANQDEKEKDSSLQKTDGNSDGSDDDVISEQKIKEFFMGLLDCNAERKNDLGIISLFNSFGLSQKNSKPDLIFLPFEFSVTGEENSGHGNLRVLSNSAEKKIAINIFYSGKKYAFVIYFEADKCNKIEAAIFPEGQVAFLDSFKKNLRAEVGVDVQLRKFEEICGFVCDDSPIAVFRGEA